MLRLVTPKYRAAALACAALVWAALACATNACTSVLGIDDLPRAADAGPEEVPVAYAAEACARCVSESCSPVAAACGKNGACDALQRCIAACAPDDLRCRSACARADTVAAGAAPFAPLDDCTRRSCAVACHGSGGLAQLYARPGAACACLDEKCATETLACVRSGADAAGARVGVCEQALACLLGEGRNPDARTRCFMKTAEEGRAELAAVDSCINSGACADCPLGTDFDCRGSYEITSVASNVTSVPYALTVNNFNREPVAANAKVCLAFDCQECTTGTDGGSTKDGILSVSLPTPRGGFEGCIHLTADGYLPLIWYPGRRITRYEDYWFAGMVQQVIAEVLAGRAGTTFELTKGTVVGVVYDCAVSTAAGVTVETLGGEKAVYVDRSTLAVTREATVTGGTFVFLNLAPGAHTVVARTAAAGEISRHDVAVRAGTITSVFLFPPAKP